MIQYPWHGCQVLRPPSELPGFKYLNEIGAKNEPFNSTTLNKQIVTFKVYKISNSNKLHVSIMQTLQTCKKTYNFKLKTWWKKQVENMNSTLSNLQHQDHKITKNDDTSSTP